MTTLLDIVDIASSALWVLLALVAMRLWVQHRSEAAAWVAGAFVATGSVVVIAQFLPPEGSPTAVIKMVIIGILALPWCLHRFTVSMEGIRPVLGRILDGLVVAMALATLALPSFPDPDEDPSTGLLIYTFSFLGVWAVLGGRTAWRLFRASSGQPGVIRGRLRTLGAASIGLVLAIVVPNGSESEARNLAGALFGLASGGLFLVGFAPPRMLRTSWRQDEEAELQSAIGRLMLATTDDDVARTVLPSMSGLIGADAGVILDPTGHVRARHGVFDDLSIFDEDEDEGQGAVTRLTLAGGDLLLLRTSSYAPMFGTDERRLLERLAAMVDLATDRAALLSSERVARRDAERANREVEAFVATITHDLRNPLTAIVGMSDLLVGPLRDELSERAQTFVTRISANADYMTGMVRDILDLAEISVVTTVSEPVDLGLVATVVREEAILRDPSVEVVIGALPTIIGDPTHARRLFENIIGNAVKHAGRRDVRVTVTSRQVDDEMELSFQDNGRGIPADAAEQVFGLFEQLSSDEETEGSGLGLAICRKLVDQLGGRLWFEPSDVGAHLCIRIPRSRVLPRGEGRAAKPEELENASQGEQP